MLKQDNPQYTIDHDGNFLFVVKIEGEPRPDFVAVVEVKMEGKIFHFHLDFLIMIGWDFCEPICLSNTWKLLFS